MFFDGVKSIFMVTYVSSLAIFSDLPATCILVEFRFCNQLEYTRLSLTIWK
ncbi:hypothetical protein THTE_3772 [Thermogutta terrifontis]|uniref:Uncharacterized protein n=1 Tax=Thermogutta terrifontis TaxID=1331910 RepID=A0A286RK64_9BACT|nr:hypothetical protein THTE_3772 [Thermogutta terrifontis]